MKTTLRFVFKDHITCNSSCLDILKGGNFLSLSAYRIRNFGMEIFECFHGMKWMTYFVNKKHSMTCKIKPYLSNLKFLLNRSVRYYGAKLWNIMPFEIKNTDDYDDFEIKLNMPIMHGVIQAISINQKYSDFPPCIHTYCICMYYVYSLVIKHFDLLMIFRYTCSFWIWVYFYWGHFYLRQRYVLRVNFVYRKWMILLRLSQTRFIIMYYFILFYLAFVIIISSNDGGITFTWLPISYNNLV